MRIAAMVPNFYPYSGGGVERVAYKIYEKLTDWGVSVDVFSCSSAVKHRTEIWLKETYFRVFVLYYTRATLKERTKQLN